MCRKPSIDVTTLEALKVLSETYHRSHDRRVGHELQVLVASLAFFGAAAGIKLSTSFDSSASLFNHIMIVAFIGVCCIVTVYLEMSARSNDLDLAKARGADEVILEYLKKGTTEHIAECLTEAKTDAGSPSRNRWWWEVAAIWGGALVAVALLLSSGQIAEPTSRADRKTPPFRSDVSSINQGMYPRNGLCSDFAN